MTERFPVGTQVQVKNEGHGSSFRSETERVGEFSGVVISTSGPDYSGIPEVCVESAAGERRVILVGDLEGATESTTRPTMKTATVPQKNTGRANVREVSKLLRAAGLTPYNPERGGARSGYKASQDGAEVIVSWRGGADTDLMTDDQWGQTRADMNDSYMGILETAGYPLRRSGVGLPVYVTGSKRKA